MHRKIPVLYLTKKQGLVDVGDMLNVSWLTDEGMPCTQRSAGTLQAALSRKESDLLH
ncbi:MAG: hypothetical protein ACHP65_10180 [Legionellales bacterium]